jgi:hypothetical protein
MESEGVSDSIQIFIVKEEEEQVLRDFLHFLDCDEVKIFKLKDVIGNHLSKDGQIEQFDPSKLKITSMKDLFHLTFKPSSEEEIDSLNIPFKYGD